MDFRTVLPVPKSNFPMDYNSKIVSLGSCFAENMAEKFEYYKFQNTVNPFGIIFNPVSIERMIRRIVHKEFFTEQDIFFYNERWQCYEVHSELSLSDKKEFLDILNEGITTAHAQFLEATHVTITLGTAWVYRNIESKEIVANCHKVPQKEFMKELLTVETIGESLKNCMATISSLNPKAKFIITVSPVRHLKDGFVENQRSKSHLITALHSVLNLNTSEYFPSYEIMMDELREYRFYSEDMLHPNEIAIQYLWNVFSESHFAKDTKDLMKEVDAIQKALQHRSFNPDSVAHQKFKENLSGKIDAIQKRIPFICF